MTEGPGFGKKFTLEHDWRSQRQISDTGNELKMVPARMKKAES